MLLTPCGIYFLLVHLCFSVTECVCYSPEPCYCYFYNNVEFLYLKLKHVWFAQNFLMYYLQLSTSSLIQVVNFMSDKLRFCWNTCLEFSDLKRSCLVYVTSNFCFQISNISSEYKIRIKLKYLYIIYIVQSDFL